MILLRCGAPRKPPTPTLDAPYLKRFLGPLLPLSHQDAGHAAVRKIRSVERCRAPPPLVILARLIFGALAWTTEYHLATCGSTIEADATCISPMAVLRHLIVPESLRLPFQTLFKNNFPTWVQYQKPFLESGFRLIEEELSRM
jgi:hypothetical protein